MNKDQLAQQMFGKSYADLSISQQIKVDDAADALKPITGTATPGTNDPTGFVQYDDAGQAFVNGTRDPSKDRRPTGGGGPTVNVNAGSPGATASVSEAQLQAAGFAESPDQPGYWVKKDAQGITHAFEARRSATGVIGYDDVTGRDYAINNPKPDKTTDKPLSQGQQILNNRLAVTQGLSGAQSAGASMGGSAPPSPTANPAASAPAPATNTQAPIGSMANFDQGRNALVQTAQPTMGQKAQSPGLIMPTGTDTALSSQYIPYNSMFDTLNASHIAPTGDVEKDAALYAAALTKRNILSQPDASGNATQDPLTVQAMIDAEWRNQGASRATPGSLTEKGAGAPAVGAPIGRNPPAFGTQEYYDLLNGTQGGQPFASGGNFNTRNPIAMVDMVTGQTMGMVGGTGREKIEVTPQGPHGSNAMEAEVGSRMWPEATGAKTAAFGANNWEDLLANQGGTSSGPLTEGGSSTPLPTTASSQQGLPGNETMGVDNRPNAAGWSNPASTADPSRAYDTSTGSSESFGRGNSAGGYYGKDGGLGAIGSYMWDPHDIPGSIARKAAIGWGSPDMPWDQMPATNDNWTRFVQLHLNDPLTKLPARLLPAEFLRSPEEQRLIYGALHPGQGWLDPRGGYVNEGVTMASGGSGWTGGDPADPYGPGGIKNTDSLLTNKFGGASFGTLANWSNPQTWDSFTPQGQTNAWNSLPYGGLGQGNPWTGGPFLPRASWLPMLQNGQLQYTLGGSAPLPFDAYREAGVSPMSTNNPARFTSTDQFMNTPVSQIQANNYATSAPATAAGGGMGMVGGGAVSPLMANPGVMSPEMAMNMRANKDTIMNPLKALQKMRA